MSNANELNLSENSPLTVVEPQQKSEEHSRAYAPGFSKLKEGDEELVHGKIIRTLISKHQDYIVYLDEDSNVWWATKKDLNCFDTPQAGEILNEVSYLEAVDVNALRPHQVLAFRRMLGEAVARLLDARDPKQAKNVLRYARNYMTARYAENARLWYLSASGLATLLVITVIAFFLILAQGRLVLTADVVSYPVAIAAGAIGALLSILLRSETVPKDISAGKRLYYSEAVAKILAGMIGALLVALGIETKFFFGTFQGNNQLALVALFGIAAGASERLIPSLINKVELSNSAD
jgi:hypothetical protein